MFILSSPRSCLVLSLTPSVTLHPNNISDYLSGEEAQPPTLKPKGIYFIITQVTTGTGSHTGTLLGFPLLPMPWHTKLQMFQTLASGWMSTELLTWYGLQWQWATPPFGSSAGSSLPRVSGCQAPRPEGCAPSAWAQMPWSWRHSRSDWIQL